MADSPERKAAVLKRMLSPHNMAIGQAAQEEEISEGALFQRRAKVRDEGQLLPDSDAGPEGWPSRVRFAAVRANRAMLHAKARAQNPERWSGKTRNWQPAGPVWLNPEREVSAPEIRDAA